MFERPMPQNEEALEAVEKLRQLLTCSVYGVQSRDKRRRGEKTKYQALGNTFSIYLMYCMYAHV